MARGSDNASDSLAQTYNAGDLGPAEVWQYCIVDDAGKGLMRAAMQQMQMSAHAYPRILKLARTIADLERQNRNAASGGGDSVPTAKAGVES